MLIRLHYTTSALQNKMDFFQKNMDKTDFLMHLSAKSKDLAQRCDRIQAARAKKQTKKATARETSSRKRLHPSKAKDLIRRLGGFHPSVGDGKRLLWGENEKKAFGGCRFCRYAHFVRSIYRAVRGSIYLGCASVRYTAYRRSISSLRSGVPCFAREKPLAVFCQAFFAKKAEEAPVKSKEPRAVTLGFLLFKIRFSRSGR